MSTAVHVLARLPDEGAPNLLFLLFHGHAQDESAMSPLAQALAAEYPQAAVLSVRAPQPADVLPGREASVGYQFFSRLGVDDDNRAERVLAAVPGFVAQVRALQQRFRIDWDRTALAGFSQGAIVALEAVQAEPKLASRVLAFGGRHALQPRHWPEDTTFHLLHGLNDPVVPWAPIVDSAERFVALGGDVTADVLPDVGHELHPALIDKALEHLRNFLPKKVWRDAVNEAPLMGRAASSRELE